MIGKKDILNTVDFAFTIFYLIFFVFVYNVSIDNEIYMKIQQFCWMVVLFPAFLYPIVTKAAEKSDLGLGLGKCILSPIIGQAVAYGVYFFRKDLTHNNSSESLTVFAIFVILTTAISALSYFAGYYSAGISRKNNSL